MIPEFGDERLLSYSPILKPVMFNEVCCVVVDREPKRIDPAADGFLPSRVTTNCRYGRGSERRTPDDPVPAPPTRTAGNEA